MGYTWSKNRNQPRDVNNVSKLTYVVKVIDLDKFAEFRKKNGPFYWGFGGLFFSYVYTQ